jgi:hypothetical protein
MASLQEMYRILAPSGTSWIQLCEIGPQLFCDDNSIPPNAASMVWTNLFFTPGRIGNTLGTANFDEIATTLRTRTQTVGFVDVEEIVDKAPVGAWHPGTSNSVLLKVDPRMNRIGRCVAQYWLGFLEAMRPVLEPIYGSMEAVENVINQVRADYANPNYRGYNNMYLLVSSVIDNSHCVIGRKPGLQG